MTVLGVEKIDKSPQSPKSYLYTEVVKSHLGEQASLVCLYLLSHGRLTAQQLSQLTKLPVFNAKQSLVSLVQLNIVTYHTDIPAKKVFYQFNELAVWKLVYSGEIINQVNVIYQDESMTRIVQNILNYGYLTFSDYLSNTPSDDEIVLHRLFIKLLQDKWLIPVGKVHFQTKFDLYNDLFKSQLLKLDKEAKGQTQAKKIAEVKLTTGDLFMKLLQPEIKCTKVVNGEMKMVGSVPLTFNLNRFLQRKRSLALEGLARHRVGPLSAKIYSIVLSKFEKNSTDVIDDQVEVLKYSNNIMVTSTGLDPEALKAVKETAAFKKMKQTSFNANDVMRDINHINKTGKDTVDLKNSIIKPELLNSKDEDSGPARKKIKLEITEDLENFDSSSVVEDSEVSILMQHLKILAQAGLLQESTPGKFHIPIQEVVDILRLETLLQLIKLILGPECLRIVNCIRSMKLVDEKMLNSVLLMKDSAIRSNLNKLSMFNFLELQEIPKTNDRLAIRTVYAFKFDEKNVISKMSNSLYYILAEILSNIEALKLENKILLDKCNRDDVKGKELDVLIENELVKLKEIMDSELSDLKKFQRILSLVHLFEL